MILKGERIYNACALLPSNEIMQIKTVPDKTEIEAGVCAGEGISVVQFNEKKIVIVICADISRMDKISTAGADIMLFIYHFIPENYKKHISNLIGISKERNIPILTASLASDKNYGHSCYVHDSTIVSLGNHEGIMEIII